MEPIEYEHNTLKPPKWRGARPFRRHSLVLIVAGLVYVAIGFAYIRADPTPAREQSLKYALNFLSYNNWGYVFCLVGVLAIISSRWPPVSETWGYMVLTGQSSAWALFYGAGILFGDSPMGNVTGVLSWGLIGFMWWAISDLLNPEVIGAMWERIFELQDENLALHDEVNRLRSRPD